MGQYIRIPGGRSVTIAEYVRSWKILLTVAPGANVPRWGDWGGTAAEVLQEIRAGIHDRINRKDPRYPKGRKAGADYQRALAQFRLYVENPRVIISWIDPILGPRIVQAYGHRLRTNLVD